MTQTHRRRLLALTLTAVLSLTYALADPPAPPNKAVVPFEMLPTNHMVVKAKINDQGPFRFIFDLGAPITLLSNRAGERSGAVKRDAPRSLLFSVRGESEVKSLEIGGLTAKNVPVVILDHPVLRALGSFLGKPLDGILGYTFFARYKTTIDYQTRTMTFEPVNAEVRNLLKELPGRLAGPKTVRHRTLAPGALWGLSVGEPEGGLDNPGVPIRAVLPESPAATAGLKPGDLLTTLDGRWTASVADTYAAAEGIVPGQVVSVVVFRDGKELTLTVRPAMGL
jgi:aspartyl protease/PDZ domain-containing protein